MRALGASFVPVPLAATDTYPLWLNIVIFVTAAAFIWPAGTRLARDLGEISTITGIEQAVIGMLLMGGITSLPEVANCLTSAYIGNPALAVNNLLGSASINVVLLAIVDAVIGRDALTSVVARPAILMQATLCMLVLALVATAVASGDVLIFGIGMWSTGLFVLSIGAFWLSAGYGGRTAWTLKEMTSVAADAVKPSREASGAADDGLGRLIMRVVIAGAVIFIAGYVLAQTGDALARQTTLGTGMVGFLLIGVSTSLPELSTITAAVRMHRHEMAIGEVLGTNFVNIMLILLADAVFVGGPVIDELGRFETISALLGVVLIGLYLIGLLEHRNAVVLHMGYDSLAVLLVFAGGLALLFAVR